MMMIHRMIVGGEVVAQIHYNEGHLFLLYVEEVLMVLFLQDGMEQVAHLLHLQRHRVHLRGLQLVPLPLVMAVVRMVVVEVVTLLQDHLVQNNLVEEYN
jgi:hypothetical protein